jgi:putative membrane protein
MAFGFVIERFGVFLQIVGREETKVFQRHISFFVGVSFILLAAFVAVYSAWQHWRILKTINPHDIPVGYHIYAGMIVNSILGGLAVALSVYITRGFV